MPSERKLIISEEEYYGRVVYAAEHPRKHGFGGENAVFNPQTIQLRVVHADSVVHILIEDGEHDAGQRGEQHVVKLHHILVEARLATPCIEGCEKKLDERVAAKYVKNKKEDQSIV